MAAGAAEDVADWLVLPGVLDDGDPLPFRPLINFKDCVVADNPSLDATDVTPAGGGGGGGSGGPTFDAAIHSASIKVTRVTSWGRFKVSTIAGAVTITAWDSAAEGDQIDLLDVKRAFGTHAVTFAGNGHNVEDPYDQSVAPAAAYSSPAGFSDLALSWVLVNDGSQLYWKAL